MERRSVLLINQHWLVDEFRELGWDTRSVGLPSTACDLSHFDVGTDIRDVLEYLSPDFIPEAIIYFDNSSTLWLSGLDEVDVPTVFYSVDAHHHHAWHPVMSGAFDYTFVAQPDYLKYFHTLGIDAKWLPLWPPHHLVPIEPKTIECSFRGSMSSSDSNRTRFFRELAKLVPGDYGSGDYTPVYVRSKVVVNHTILADVNFRVFEATLAGAALVTPDIDNGFRELFEPGVELLTYRRGDAEDAARVIRYALENEEERKQIASRGRERTLRQHLGKYRALEFVRAIESGVREKRWKHLSSARMLLATAAALYLNPKKESEEEVKQGAIRCTIAAFNALERSARSAEGCSTDFVSCVFMVRYWIERLGLNATTDQNYLGSVLTWWNRIRECYPTDGLLALAHSELLLEDGNQEAALAILEPISHSPQELLAASSALLDQVRSEINEALATWRDLYRPQATS